MIVDGLIFLAIDLVEGRRVTRLLELNGVTSDVETGFEIVDTHEDGSLEWRVDGSRGEVGGNGESSCTVSPAAWFAQCE